MSGWRRWGEEGRGYVWGFLGKRAEGNHVIFCKGKCLIEVAAFAWVCGKTSCWSRRANNVDRHRPVEFTFGTIIWWHRVNVFSSLSWLQAPSFPSSSSLQFLKSIFLPLRLLPKVYAVYEPWRVTALRFRRVGGFESFHSMQALRWGRDGPVVALWSSERRANLGQVSK